MSVFGYDPVRIGRLRTRLAEAIAQLRAIEADGAAHDALAGDALHAVSLMRRNLEEAWMPAVDAIHHSEAMTVWRQVHELVGAGSPTATSLADRIDALVAWMGTSAFEALDDAELARRLDDASAAFVLAARTGDGLLTAWAHVDVLANEARRRLDEGARQGDDAVAAALWAHLGADGLDRVVAVLDTAGEITDLDLLAGSTDTRAANERLQLTLGSTIGALVAADDGVLEHLVETIPHSSHLAHAVAAAPDAFGSAAVVALTNELLDYTTGSGEWSSRPRVAERHRSASTLLAAVAGRPAWALEVASDPARLEAIVVDPHFDADGVEAIVASALGAPAGDATALGDGLALLADLVAISDRAPLNVGARRGVALGIGTYLPAVGIQLDPRLPVHVPLPDSARADDAAVVRLGTYAEVVGLLGQVVADTQAQLALGVTIGAFRGDQIERATATIVNRPDFDARSAGVQLSADLAAVSRVIDTVTAAIAHENEMMALRHGMAQADARSVAGLLETTVSALPMVGPGAARVSRLTTRGVMSAIGAAQPSQVPDTGLDTELAMHFTVAALGVPLLEPGLRSRLGVGRVPATTWAELSDLHGRFDDADDPDERGAIHSRILRLVDDTPDLQVYMTELGVLSGDRTLD